MYDANLGLNKIANSLGIGTKGLRLFIEKMGWSRESRAPEWTWEQAVEAAALWVDNVSASKIAEKYGITKNAVIGRIHRLPKEMTTRSGNVTPPKGGPKPQAYQKKRVHPPYVPPPESITTPEGTAFRFIDLDDTKCKWPIGEDADGHIYCCRPPVKRRAPYCEAHAQAGHQKSRPAPSSIGFRLRHGRRGI